MKHPNKRLVNIFFCYAIFANHLLTSCNKLVEVPPPTHKIADNNVFTNDATAIAVLTGIYIDINSAASSDLFVGRNGLSFRAGLSADELALFDENADLTSQLYFRNRLSVLPGGMGAAGAGFESWSSFYYYIYRCNAAIEGLSTSTSLSPNVRQQLLGEAKFLRGFLFFYLVNLFGDVPLAITTDYKTNASLTREAKSVIYEQVIKDLSEAESLLNEVYLDGSLGAYSDISERLRPTKWAATAMLARTHLYVGEYSTAEAEATRVINQTSLFNLALLDDVFLKNSSEAIWQLQPVSLTKNTEDGYIFDLSATGPNSSDHNVFLNTLLLNTFELGDQRRSTWIDSISAEGTTYYYPYKYKNNASGPPYTEYTMVLRLAEQYLIRAEARSMLNDIAGAQSDLNAIRNRVGLPNTNASDQISLLTAILHERQTELFTEWGHRWLDLKRTGTINDVMTVVTPLKAGGEPWRSYQQWYPLPFIDLERDINLVQNEGY
jgi:starch-binding outer membrane protein, SusD/RagB family